MKVTVYNTMELENVTTYDVKEIEGYGYIPLTEEEKQMVRDGKYTPMLNIRTTDKRNIAIPIQFLISITE